MFDVSIHCSVHCLVNEHKKSVGLSVHVGMFTQKGVDLKLFHTKKSCQMSRSKDSWDHQAVRKTRDGTGPRAAQPEASRPRCLSKRSGLGTTDLAREPGDGAPMPVVKGGVGARVDQGRLDDSGK